MTISWPQQTLSWIYRQEVNRPPGCDYYTIKLRYSTFLSAGPHFVIFRYCRDTVLIFILFVTVCFIHVSIIHIFNSYLLHINEMTAYKF